MPHREILPPWAARSRDFDIIGEGINTPATVEDVGCPLKLKGGRCSSDSWGITCIPRSGRVPFSVDLELPWHSRVDKAQKPAVFQNDGEQASFTPPYGDDHTDEDKRAGYVFDHVTVPLAQTVLDRFNG